MESKSPAELLALLFPIHYSDISGHEDVRICAAWNPVHYHSQRLLIELFKLWLPDVAASTAYDWCIEAGELLSEDTIRQLWNFLNA